MSNPLPSFEGRVAVINSEAPILMVNSGASRSSIFGLISKANPTVHAVQALVAREENAPMSLDEVPLPSRKKVINLDDIELDLEDEYFNSGLLVESYGGRQYVKEGVLHVTRSGRAYQGNQPTRSRSPGPSMQPV